MAALAVAGGMSSDELRRWRARIGEQKDRATDPARAAGDRLPGLMDAAWHVASFVRHPRAFLKELWQDAGVARPRPRG